MASATRILTSILGTVIHLIASLAAIVALLLLLATVVFAMPSTIGALGVDHFLGNETLGEVVAEAEATTIISMPLLVGALLASLLVFGVGTKAGFALYGVGTADEPANQKEIADETTEAEPADPARRYLRGFRRSNVWFGGLLAVVLASALTLRIVVENGLVNAGVVETVAGLLWIGVLVFGGTFELTLTAAIFLAVWYGLNHEATEALLVGIAVWGLLGLSGLRILAESGSGLGVAMAGAIGVYYGVRALDATEPATAAGRGALEGSSASTGEGDRDTTHPADPASASTGSGGVGHAMGRIRRGEVQSLEAWMAILELEPTFVHPREADNERLTYWSYLSYVLGCLTLLGSLLVGIRLWGFPTLGLWGIPLGLLYLGHAFGVPQRSSVAHHGGFVLYGIGCYLAMSSASPLALLGNAAGVYLGWTGTPDLRQPAAVLASIRGRQGGRPGSEASNAAPDRLVAGYLEGAIVGGVLGVIGAAIFAWVSIQTETVYAVLGLLPPAAAGFGVALGVGRRGGLSSGIIGAVVGLLSINLGYQLLIRWMPPFYEYQPGAVDAIILIAGLYVAFKLGTGPRVVTGGTASDHGTAVQPSADEDDEPTAATEQPSDGGDGHVSTD